MDAFSFVEVLLHNMETLDTDHMSNQEIRQWIANFLQAMASQE